MTRFAFYENPELTLECLPADAPVLFSLNMAAGLAGVHPERLMYYCRAGLIDVLYGLAEGEFFFEESALDEIRRIEHYRRHLGVGRRALPLVGELRRQAEPQHIELRFLSDPLISDAYNGKLSPAHA